METVSHEGATMSSTTDPVEAIAAAVGAPAPEPAPAPEATASEAPASETPPLGESAAPVEDESSSDEAAPSAPPKKSSYQSRIDRLTQERYLEAAERQRAEARAAAMEIELERLRRAAEPPAPATPEPSGKPRLEQFETYEEFVEALADYKAEERIAADRRAREAEQQDRARVEAQQAYAQRESAARSEMPDYDAVVNRPDLPVSPVMVETIYESNVGPQIRYYLGQHPEECRRIATMPPARAAREMGKIEARLEAAHPAGPSSGASYVPRVANVPKPVTSSASAVTTPLDKLDFAQFKKIRDEEEQRWRASR